MPADATATKRRILDAAERLFADVGFEGVSLREIARGAEVPVTLIHYHFQTKEGLYRDVWSRRYGRVVNVRAEGLPSIDFSQPRAVVLRDIVDLFVTPLLAGPEGRPFLRILAHEFADPMEPVRGVVRDLIDPTALRFLEALRRALPTVSEADLGWGYQAMTGALMMHVVDIDRATRLTRGAARSGDTEAALPALRDYIVGGWLALAARAR